MIGYVEYLKLPVGIAAGIVAIFFAIQIIGEILEFKGKVVPEFVKIRKYFARKRKERKILHQVPDMLKDVQSSLDDFRSHYSADNITMRDKWIESVNHKLEKNDELIEKLDKKLDKNSEDTLAILIDNKRDMIISFAAKVIDENYPVTHEQFNRIFKLHAEYEKIIEDNGLTNGEIDVAHRIIMDSYEKHMKNHTFIEDIKGY